MANSDSAAPYDRFGIDPIGSAGHYAHFVFVEWRLPWKRDIFDDAALGAVKVAVERAAERGEPTRVLGLVPGSGSGSPAGTARLIRYSHTGAAYVRTEALVEVDDFAEQVIDVVEGGEPGPVHEPGDVRDLMICTHGRRDRRCGAEGLRLFEQVASRWDDVRVWRISHTGGHRFAPTGISFPEGWFWGNLTVDVLDSVMGRSGDRTELAHHLRGNAALPKPAQVLDRDAFVEHGWAWSSRPRAAEIELLDDESAAVTLAPLRGAGERSAVVGVGRRVPTTACDSLCDDPDSTTPELAVISS
ncbi:MAG: sucrase ferredoxin [Actinomycetota bacterium]